MDHDENQEPTSFMPVIARLDRLDRVLHILEEKHSLSRRDFCAVESNNNKERKTLSSALEEVQHKGTLIDRLTLLENRVLQLSLEIDEGNTSKSSSSTVQVSETTEKYSELSVLKRQDENGIKVNSQEKQDPPSIAAQVNGFVTEIAAPHNCRGQRKKPKRKWLGLFQLRC
ncbi:hypothetical protein DH2020_014328 [Rehmannia glutinosa]|uniref:Uncharacterized protein n=1 Tax=Rehmannia glutinosa TaxID=99300 RepID=A0ABR0WW38_REHGL